MLLSNVAKKRGLLVVLLTAHSLCGWPFPLSQPVALAEANEIEPNVPTNDTCKATPESSGTETANDSKKALDVAISRGANIPDDKQWIVLRMLNCNEKDIVKAFSYFVEISGGKYPTSLTAKVMIEELIAWSIIRADALSKRLSNKKEDEKKTLNIPFASAYYEKLLREKKDPAYYGDRITVEDGNSVLVRWKQSKGKYRVILGDLRIETLTADRLIELEKKLKKPQFDEVPTIQGLRNFARIINGQYPSELTTKTIMKDIEEAFKAKYDNNKTEDATKQMKQALSVISGCPFYARLVRENKDVAYYGETVMPKDCDKVLMRWKISDNQYRVIFGDLTTENVTAEKLVELEKASVK